MALADISARGISNTDFIPESVAGLAVVVLTILGLAGVAPVAEVGRMFSGYSEGQTVVELASSGLSTIFLAGAAGIVLGILALIGKVPVSLVAISAIGYGGALIISSNFTRRLRMLTVAS